MKTITKPNPEIENKSISGHLINNDHRIIEADIISVSLYNDLYKEIRYSKCLWICKDTQWIKTIFRNEIRDSDIYVWDLDNSVLTFGSQHYFLHKSENVFFISRDNPILETALQWEFWDQIVYELPQFGFESTIKAFYNKYFTISKLCFIVNPQTKNRLTHCFSNTPGLVYNRHNVQDTHILFADNEAEKMYRLVVLLKSLTGKGIIFTAQSHQAALIEDFLNWQSFSAAYFNKSDSPDEHRYLLDRFHSHYNFKSIEILIVNDLNSLNFVPQNIQWTVHYNFSDGYESYLDYLSKCFIDREPKSYLFYSHEDKLLRESQLKNSYPDSKSLRITYGLLEQGLTWGKYRFVSLSKLQNQLRFSKEKVMNSLRALKAVSLVDMGVSVIYRGRFLIDTYSISRNNSFSSDLELIFAYQKVCENQTLVDFCLAMNVSPFYLTEKLLQLEENYHLIFQEKEMIESFFIHQEEGVQLKFSLKELRKKLDLDYCLKDFRKIEALTQTNMDRGLDLSPEVNHSPKVAKITVGSLTHQLGIAILWLVNDSPFPIGKTLISQLLTGSKSKRIKELKLDSLDLYGQFEEIKADSLIALCKQLVLQGYLEEVPSVNLLMKGLRVSSQGHKLLNAQKALKQKFWRQRFLSFSNQQKSSLLALKECLTESNAKLSDSILSSITRLKPANLDELLMFKGISSKALDSLSSILYGKIASDRSLEIAINKNQDIESIEIFLANNRFPMLQGKFYKGFSLDYYSVPSESSRSYTPVGRAVHQFKYKGKEVLATIITDTAVRFLKKEKDFAAVDFICAVPSHERYPSICNELGLWLSKALKTKFIENLFIKSRNADMQKSLETVAERAKNVDHLFYLSDTYNLTGKSALLLDDIYDSGTTMDSAVEALHQTGVSRVYALTCAKTTYRSS